MSAAGTRPKPLKGPEKRAWRSLVPGEAACPSLWSRLQVEDSSPGKEYRLRLGSKKLGMCPGTSSAGSCRAAGLRWSPAEQGQTPSGPRTPAP